MHYGLDHTHTCLTQPRAAGKRTEHTEHDLVAFDSQELKTATVERQQRPNVAIEALFQRVHSFRSISRSTTSIASLRRVKAPSVCSQDGQLRFVRGLKRVVGRLVELQAIREPSQAVTLRQIELTVRSCQ